VFVIPPTVQPLITYHALTVKLLRLSLMSMSVAVAKILLNVFAAFSPHFKTVQIVLDQLTLQSLAVVLVISKGLVFHLTFVNLKEKATNQVPSGVQWAIHALPALVQVLQTWKDYSFQLVTLNVVVIVQWVMSELPIPVNVAVCVFH
jgi:hypothetical protein